MRLLLTLFFSVVLSQTGQSADNSAPKNWQVYFSPRGGCTEAVVEALNRAKSAVLVQAYSFTSPPIAKALMEAKKRGVKVQVILDKSQKTEKYSSADFVRNAGIPTFIDGRHPIAHNKVMVVDGHTVITGSFNFTKAAQESNAENLLVINDMALAARYSENWQNHLSHAEPYQGHSTVFVPSKQQRKK